MDLGDSVVAVLLRDHKSSKRNMGVARRRRMVTWQASLSRCAMEPCQIQGCGLQLRGQEELLLVPEKLDRWPVPGSHRHLANLAIGCCWSLEDKASKQRFLVDTGNVYNSLRLNYFMYTI